MADVEIAMAVAPSTDNPPVYSWSFAVFQGGVLIPDGTITIPSGAQAGISMTIAADGNPGDLCVFPQDPTQVLQFKLWDGAPIDTPLWCKDLAVPDPSLFTCMDDNTNQKTRNYYFVVNAFYQPAGGSMTPIVSPDPTIVNVGTDGSGAISF